MREGALKGASICKHAMLSVMPFKFEYTAHQWYLVTGQSVLEIKVEWTCVNLHLQDVMQKETISCN